MKFRLVLLTAILFLIVWNSSILLAQGNRMLDVRENDDYVIRNPITNFPTIEITAEFWMKASDKSLSHPISYASRRFDNEFLIGYDEQLWIYVTDTRSTKAKISPADGQWHHIAVTWRSSDGQTKFYKDGEVIHSESLAQGGLITGGGSFVIAQDQDSVGGRFDPKQAFNGFLDEIRIWNITRTQAEIQSTMNITLRGDERGLMGYWNFDDGTARDLSSNDNHGELKDGTEIVESDLLIAPIVVLPQQMIPWTAGESFAAGIEAVTVHSLHHFTFDLTFNPDILRAIHVEEGFFLSKDGIDPVTCQTPQIDNNAGRITGISCRRNKADGVSGFGVLATITFDPIRIGESTLRIENASFDDPDGNSIEFGTGEGAVTVFGPHGRITGRVIDTSGEPVRGIPVLAFKDETIIGINGETNRDGIYTVENVTEAGEVTVRAKVAGLVPGIAAVPVQIGETTSNVDFVLTPPVGLNSVVDAEGFIIDWLLISGSWDNDANRLITDQFSVTDPSKFQQPQEPETKALQPRAGDYGTGIAETLRWKLHADSDKDIDLAGLYGQVKGVVYAFTLVKSLVQQDVTLRIGSGDGVVVWLNDQLIHFNGTTRGRSADKDTVEGLRLNKGWNRLLIKVENRDGGWGFLARFADAEGTPITDLDVSPQLPIGGPGEGSTFGTFELTLDRGLNNIALPVRPLTPFTAQGLIDKFGVDGGRQPVATMVVRYDTGQETFVPYLPALSADFNLEGGIGYIINVTQPVTVTFVGSVWDNVNAAPDAEPVGANLVFAPPTVVWAFGVGGTFFGSDADGRAITVRNRRTKAILRVQMEDNHYAVAFANLNRRRVVEAGDVLEIRIGGMDGQVGANLVFAHTITAEDLRRAFARIDLSQSTFQPSATQLLQNYPNPFNPETWLPYQLAADALVDIQIYDMRGQLVRRLDLGHQSAGYYDSRHRAAHWDGQNETGEFVSSGLYFYQLRAGDYTATRRMVILK